MLNNIESNNIKSNIFSDNIINESHKILNLYKRGHYDNKDLIDLTNLTTYSIDDEDTFEIDDAISLQKVDNNYLIWIHISSPAYFITLNDPIALEAKRRSSSIYLENNITTMFPEELINSILSLNQKEERLALSVCAKLNNKGEIDDYSVQRSRINNTFRLTYDDADELIDFAPKEDQNLYLLSSLLQKRLNWRKKNGSINLEGNEPKFKYNNGKIVLSSNEISVSRVLIEEAMILMGTVVSEYAIKNNIPIPFRCQNLNSNISVDNNLHYSLKNYLIKKSFNKSYYSTKYSKHSSLGLNSYVQCTSPIRRYIDLLTHFQLFNQIECKTLLSKELIDDLISYFNNRYRQNNDIMIHNRIYMKKRYIQQNSSNVYSAYFLTWLRKDKNIANVFFENLGFEMVIKIESNNNLKFGSHIELKYSTNNTLNIAEREELISMILI
tara:strand:+ start:1391 stop:2710 length:1320 start_codon:yes stop_codon:yes gene_type:complete